MTVFFYELKMLRKSIVTWILATATFLVLYNSFYPSFGKDAAFMEKILANYPEAMLKALGMNTGLSLSSVLGYFAFTFVFVQVLLAIQASNYGFSILSIEERELTADFLMTKPISRRNIIVSKFLAVLTALIITDIGTSVFAFISIEMFKDGNDYDVSYVVILLASTIVFQLFYVAVGMLISVTTKKIRSVLSYSMALAFGTYMINAVRGILDSDLLGIITPFYHFDPNYILGHGHWNYGAASISIIVTVISLIASYVLYSRRNIHSL